MADGSVPLLVAIVVLIVLSALFSATETAYTGLNEIKVKSLIGKNSKYQNVLNLYEKYDKLLTTILIGNNITNILLSTLALVFFQKNLTNVNPELISTIVITILVLIFGEVSPKYIGKAYPERVALLNYPFIIFFYYILYPLSFLLGLLQKVVRKIFKLDHKEVITDEELITIVNEAEEDGTLKEEESDLIRSAIEFDDLEVKDILIPRTSMVAIPVTATASEISQVLKKEGYSRLPVYDGNRDTIIGIIHEKDFYRVADHKDFNIKSIMQEAIFCVEHTKISALLRKLQVRKVHMAIVLDEYGGTMGLCTMEDIIEELVGEIYDEYDEEAQEIRANHDGSYTVSGLCELDKLFEYFEIETEDEFDANTVGGWVSEELGELPQVGKSFEYKTLQIIVKTTTKKRIVEVIIKKIEPKIEVEE